MLQYGRGFNVDTMAYICVTSHVFIPLSASKAILALTDTVKLGQCYQNLINSFPSSQQCIYASLVEIHPHVQKITHVKHISDISNCRCGLENKVMVIKIYSTFPSLPTMNLRKFDQNLSAGSEYNAQKPYFGHFKVQV